MRVNVVFLENYKVDMNNIREWFIVEGSSFINSIEYRAILEKYGYIDCLEMGSVEAIENYLSDEVIYLLSLVCSRNSVCFGCLLESKFVNCLKMCNKDITVVSDRICELYNLLEVCGELNILNTNNVVRTSQELKEEYFRISRYVGRGI